MQVKYSSESRMGSPGLDMPAWLKGLSASERNQWLSQYPEVAGMSHGRFIKFREWLLQGPPTIYSARVTRWVERRVGNELHRVKRRVWASVSVRNRETHRERKAIGRVVCQECGAVIVTKSKQRKYCSDRCRQAASRLGRGVKHGWKRPDGTLAKYSDKREAKHKRVYGKGKRFWYDDRDVLAQSKAKLEAAVDKIYGIIFGD